MTTRKRFTPEYRQQAARLVLDTDRTITEVARELGINAGLLGKWVKAERDRINPESNNLDQDERAELKRLRKEVAELKLDNEFLSKAAAFFASKQRK